ncbi:hypothetical protein YC2023_016683 [Brassica napus]
MDNNEDPTFVFHVLGNILFPNSHGKTLMSNEKRNVPILCSIYTMCLQTLTKERKCLSVNRPIEIRVFLPLRRLWWPEESNTGRKLQLELIYH